MNNTFQNAQELQRQHPETFEAPSREDLLKLKVGDYAKISKGIERFWTKITEINNEEITAIIRNDLVFTDQHGLKCDDIVKFNLDNIYQFNYE